MDKFGKEVAITFFVLLLASFILGAYYVIYSGSAEPWKDLFVYKALFSMTKLLLFVFDLPVFLYILAVPSFVSANLPTLAAIIVVFFILVDISYLYFLSLTIASLVHRKRSS